MAIRRVALVVALSAVLLAGTTAQAQPPRPGLCEDLTGDALTRCLYSDLDDRLRALGSNPPSSPSPTTQPSPSSSPPEGDGEWLSGAAGPDAANGSFGTWRGDPVEIAQFWINDPAIYPIGPPVSGCGGCGEWRNFSGPLSVSIAVPQNQWQGWGPAANGVNDAFYTATFRNLRSLAGTRPVYASPHYEFNGDWMYYSVPRTAQGQADFRRAWERMATIAKREFPAVKLVLTAAAGRTLPTEMIPTNFDLIGADIYNEWPFVSTYAEARTLIDTRLEPIRRAGEARGKPMGIPEWSNAGKVRPQSAGGGGEAPDWVRALYAYLQVHGGTGPGEVVFETHFNITGYPAGFEFYAGGSVPSWHTRTAAQYRTLFRQN